MRKTIFENHRKNKIPLSEFISVITEDKKIESGWTSGRNLEEINEDFGEENTNWFWFQYRAEEYLVRQKNGNN